MATEIPCGPYRTSAAHPDHVDALAAGLLVYLHNHADAAGPVVHLPAANRNNRWTFHRGGIDIDHAYMATLEPLLREGLYRFREHFHPDDKRVVAANTLVQLGYNRAGEPIVFFPESRDEDNALVFPTRGMRITAQVYALLDPLDLRGPVTPVQIH